MSLTPQQLGRIRGAIRRQFSRDERVRAFKDRFKRKVPRYKKDGSRHKVDQVEHLCNVCKQWKPGKSEVDHIIPVVSVEEGFQDLNTFADRLFCEPSNWQVICETCHDAKTLQERRERQKIKDLSILAEIEKTLSDKSYRDDKEVLKTLKKFMKKTKAPAVQEKASSLRRIL